MSSIVCPGCKAYLGLSAAGLTACPKCAAPLAVPKRGPSREEREAQKQGDHDLVHGALWLIGGLVVTGVTYLAAEVRGEGYYLLAWGPIVFGGIQFLSGLYRSVHGHRKPETGSCRKCRHSPVEAGAKRCPQCGTRDPNPGYFYRYVGRGMLLGILVCAGIGGVIGLGTKDAEHAWVPALFGAFAGLILGMFAGMGLSLLRWLIRGR